MSMYFENDATIKSKKQKIKINYKDLSLEIYTDNGLFSKDKFDYGSRLLLETITQNNLSGKILDLGCGYGVIGIILALNYPQTTVDMVDITDRAIEIAKENISNLNIQNANIFKSDIYENIISKYDYIITNPPIRAGKDTIRKFLLEAKDHLTDTGELWFVMRKDHGVKSIIKELEQYYLISVEEKTKGFYIIKCETK